MSHRFPLAPFTRSRALSRRGDLRLLSLDSEDTGTNRAATYADSDGAGRFRNSRV